MTLTEHIQIEEILAEANSYNLKPEVIKLADKIEILHNLSRVDAYQLAFTTLIDKLS